MTEQLLYACSQFGMGWWPLLEKYIPAILALDPECEFEPKEKYGTLRLQATCSIDLDSNKRQEIYRLEDEAENESAKVCEYCGKPGRLRTEKRSWWETLCDECEALDKESYRTLYLGRQMLLGKKYEEFIGPERKKELWEQWCALPVKNTLQSDEYKAWYRGLSLDEQGAVLGWNAEVEDHVRSEM